MKKTMLMKEGTENDKKRQQSRAWMRMLATTDRHKKNEAATGLFNTFQKPLSNWFKTNAGTTSDMLDVKDLVQITMEKVFSKASTYSPDNSEVSTWIYKIALNVLLDHKRKWRGKDIVSIDKINEIMNLRDSADVTVFEIRSPERTPDVLAGAQQAHAMVRKAVASMKHRERMAIELRFFEERTYEEIAHQMEIPMTMVKTLLFRAKESLGKILPKESMITA